MEMDDLFYCLVNIVYHTIPPNAGHIIVALLHEVSAGMLRIFLLYFRFSRESDSLSCFFLL